MAPKLYMIESSPPVTSVLLTAKAVGVTLDLILVDISKGEHLTPKFVKMNPQHSVPTLDDDGFIIWDSHAINIYLILKYAKDNSLYPKDPKRQAIIHQRLHFDSGMYFPVGVNIIKPIINQEVKTVPPEKAERVIEAYGFLEAFLKGQQWAAGDRVTVADLVLIPSTTCNAVLVPIDEYKFPNIIAWLKRCENLPYYDVNQTGLDNYRALVLKSLRS